MEADMAYNLKLAERMRAELKGIPFVEKKMFGGVGFLIHGNMACGVHKENMIVRVDHEKHDKLLKKSHAKTFDITGKPMKGWLMVEPDGYRTAKQLNAWVKEGVEFALTLPPK
jgi:TfoX/Sxy family transcriptional regulator of competence genes